MNLFSSRKRKQPAVPRGFRPRLSDSSPFDIKEAFNSIRTKLIFTGKGEKCPVFAISSPLVANGKTTNAVSLAISFAIAEQRVLLIDADLRRPSVHRYFNADVQNGLSEVLAGLSAEINLRTTEYPHLQILTAGQVPPNPAELLGSKQMDALLDYVRKQFDYIILDTPPVNIVTDAAVLADKVTGYIMVVQSGKNHLRDLNDAVSSLEEMNGRIVGFVLNDSEDKAASHYGYHYKKNYRYDRNSAYGNDSASRK